MAEKYFQQNNWLYGLSESETSGGLGYFSKSFGVDIHTIPGVLRAAVAPQKESGAIVTDFCKFAVDASRGTTTTVQQSFWFGDNGQIYRRLITTSGLVSWGTTYFHSPTVNINGAWEFNSYIYWTSAGSIHRISLDDALRGEWGSGSVTLGWGTLNNTDYHSSVIIGTYCLISNGTTIASIGDTGTITASGIPNVALAHLPANYEITSLHKYGIDVLVGTKIKGGISGAKLLRWDIASPAFTQDIDVPESIVNCFLTTNNRTYLQAGNKGKIYEYNGVSVSPFKKIPMLNDDAVSEENTLVFPQSSTNYYGIGYWGVSNQTGSSLFAIPGIYALGKRNEKYPISLSHQFVPSVVNESNTDVRIGAVISGRHHNTQIPYLVFSWKDATVPSYGIDAIHNNVNKFSGAYIETQAISGNSQTQKTFGNHVVSYKALPASTNISCEYYKNFSSGTSGVISLTNKSDYNNMVSNQKIEAGAMKYRLSLITSASSTPEISAFYTDWNEKSVL
mgnify:CR=1 FL=1